VHCATNRENQAIAGQLQRQRTAKFQRRRQQCRGGDGLPEQRFDAPGILLMTAQIAPGLIQADPESRAPAASRSGNRRNSPGAAARRSATEFLLQQLIQLCGIGLARGRLHDLANKEPEQLLLAGPIVGQLAGFAAIIASMARSMADESVI